MQCRVKNMAAGQFYTLWFEKNLQGDIVAVYDDSGNKLYSYAYDAWGNCVATRHSTSTAARYAQYNPFRYRGYYYDSETGFYYLQSRYYDPHTGRFLNADGQLNGGLLGYNQFAYCENNPVMGVDPTGSWPDWNKFGLGLMFAGLGVLTIASVALTGGTCVPVVALAYATLATAGTVAIGVGASEVVESFTGENPLKEEIGEEAYDIAKFGSAAVMSMGSTIIEYGTSVSVCFVAGTPVRAENGSLPIEEIEAGMRVYAHDPETGETALKRVVRTFRNEATELVHVTVGGEEIVCTNEHPFYSPIKGWIAACDLRAGDILVTVNGEYVVVERVQHELLESPIAVYNFEVEGFHTYFVANSAILVHNDCGSKSYSLNGAKDQKYLEKRGWTDQSINQAINNGRQGTSINMANGEPCIVYRHPGSPNQYVVIEEASRNLVQVSNLFDGGWIPDPRIVWDP